MLFYGFILFFVLFFILFLQENTAKFRYYDHSKLRPFHH